MLQLCVCREIEHLGSLESTQEAREPLSCSPNFPRAQYLDICTLTHELILNSRKYKFHAIERKTADFFEPSEILFSLKQC